MNTKKDSLRLTDLASQLVCFGKKAGADEVEVSISEVSEFTVDIRLQQIESLVEAGSRYIGLRVLKDKKSAAASSSDLSQKTLHTLMENAVKRAELSSPDEFAGLPPKTEDHTLIPSLDLFDPEIPALDSKKKIHLALETEKIALENKKITNSHGASFETREIRTVLANSNGFVDEYRETVCGLSLGLQAGETDNLVEDSWFSSKRHFNELESPENIAKKAVERTVRLLKPKKVRTQNVPVVFEPMMTAWLLGFLFGCISGVSVYQKTSFLAGRLKEKIAGSNITVIDDGLMPGKLGTRPFDSEGIPSQRTEVIKHGVLKNYLCNTYAARKLKLQTTGNAEGHSISPNNFFLLPGSSSPEEIIQSLDRGLILVRTIGHGLNPVTGDISRGAFGLWVEKGEIVYPVSEITISGNLGKILNDIELLGNDLEFLSSIAGPTTKVRELTVAGE